MRRTLAGLIVAALLAPGVQAASVPAPDPAQGDGRVSPFYTWTGAIPDTPGQMLRTEPLVPELSLDQAARGIRILYTSTDGVDGKTAVAVSGAFFVPKGTPPAGGWPIIAWAHGTTGVADICAPSWQARSYRDVSYLNTWLSQGYAVVATDYQGLGTPGPHPYLLARPQAYSVLDSVRAVLHSQPDLANRIVIVGQSQGGGAAFATAGYAPAYAPDLDIRGTVATGVPFFTPAILRPPAHPNTEKPDPTVAYNLYIALMMMQADRSLSPADLVTSRAQPLLDLARVTCVGPLFSDLLSAGLNRSNALAPAYPTTFAKVLPAMEFPTLTLKQPIFIGTGEEDHDVPPAGQLALVKQACAAGTLVEAHLYRGLNHSATVNASLKDSLPFVRKVLAGEPIAPRCEPAPE